MKRLFGTTFSRTALGLVALLGTAMAAPEAWAQSWPSKPVTIVVPSGAGGSLDRLSRAMAPFLSEELGQPVNVINKTGARTILGSRYVLKQPADGHTILASLPTPLMVTSILEGRAGFTLDDFAFINAQWTDWSIMVVPKDKPFKTLDELIAAIKAQPGKVTTSAIPGSITSILVDVMLDKLGLPRDSITKVTYQNGIKMRTAVLGGHVDFAFDVAAGAFPFRDAIRPLAVFRPTRQEGWDAPPVNEALAKYGAKMPLIEDTVRSFAVPAAFRDKRPADWNRLVEAHRKVLARADVRAALAKARMGSAWHGPAATRKMIDDVAELITPFVKKAK